MTVAEITDYLKANEAIMKNNKLIQDYLESNYEEKISLIKFLTQYYQDNNNLPLHTGNESFSINESLRKSQNINFAPSLQGCPVCGK